ncbi:MAG: hypothetical protein K6T28_04400 [Acidothermus sp.]|nr:hypothetical protein [Acidothermus sp.]
MIQQVVGLVLAFATAGATGVASVLQAVAVRHQMSQGDRRTARSASRAVVQPLYLAGTGLDVVGFACMVGALRWLPLFLVQCAATASVAVTAAIGRRVLGTSLHRSSRWALVSMLAGLVLLASGARPGSAPQTPGVVQGALLAGAGILAILGVISLRARRLGSVQAVLAGLAFAGTGVGARILSAVHSLEDALRSPATYALALCGVTGMLLFAASLERTSVTLANAIVFAVETSTASAVGLALLGDQTRAGFLVPTALGFVVTVGSAVALALDRTAMPAPETADQPAR